MSKLNRKLNPADVYGQVSLGSEHEARPIVRARGLGTPPPRLLFYHRKAFRVALIVGLGSLLMLPTIGFAYPASYGCDRSTPKSDDVRHLH